MYLLSKGDKNEILSRQSTPSAPPWDGVAGRRNYLLLDMTGSWDELFRVTTIPCFSRWNYNVYTGSYSKANLFDRHPQSCEKNATSFSW